MERFYDRYTTSPCKFFKFGDAVSLERRRMIQKKSSALGFGMFGMQLLELGKV